MNRLEGDFVLEMIMSRGILSGGIQLISKRTLNMSLFAKSNHIGEHLPYLIRTHKHLGNAAFDFYIAKNKDL